MTKVIIKNIVILIVAACVITAWSIFVTARKKGYDIGIKVPMLQDEATAPDNLANPNEPEIPEPAAASIDVVAGKRPQVLSSGEKKAPWILGETEAASEEPIDIGTSITIEKAGLDEVEDKNNTNEDEPEFTRGVTTSFSIEE